jgi:hypothetical protein
MVPGFHYSYVVNVTLIWLRFSMNKIVNACIMAAKRENILALICPLHMKNVGMGMLKRQHWRLS